MNCEQAKQSIRTGDLERAAGHIRTCDDCRAFAEDFGDVAGRLEAAGSVGEPSRELFTETLALATQELRRITGQASEVRGTRTIIAGALAIVFAPLLLFANYWIAAAGRSLLTHWFPPAVGTLFFAVYALGAVFTMSIAYGSLPLLIAAAQDALRLRTIQEV
jgi:hypothetical protein